MRTSDLLKKSFIFYGAQEGCLIFPSDYKFSIEFVD